MKFLDAKRNPGEPASNKMLRGTREDQGGAKSPVSSGTSTVRPEVRELADALEVELSSVTGTGKNGSITMGDVRKAAADREEQERNDPSGH